MNVAEILKWIRTTDPKTLPYNISGLGWGPKIKNGKETGEYCLIFQVLEKKNKDKLNFSEIVPKIFNIEDNEVITDVLEQEVQHTLLNLPDYIINPSFSENTDINQDLEFKSSENFSNNFDFVANYTSDFLNYFDILPPSYIVEPNFPLEMYENQGIAFKVTIFNPITGTSVYWSISSPTMDQSDFTTTPLSGTIYVPNDFVGTQGNATITIVLSADYIKEGPEIFSLVLREVTEFVPASSILTIGPLITSSGTITVLDAVPDCHEGPTLYDPPSPIALNRQKHRPLRGGTSSIHALGSDATLGLFVRDKSDGSVVALSNSHVYGVSQVSTRTGFPLNGGGAPWMNTNTLAITCIQPALDTFNPYGASSGDPNDPGNRADTWATYISGATIDNIGTCKRTVVIGNEGNDEIYRRPLNSINGFPIIKASCDAAIVQLSSYNLISEESVNILHFEQTGPYSFATDIEIDSLLDPSSLNFGSPIFRSGRTCGPIGYPGYSSSCSLSTYQFGTELVGTYNGHLGNFTNSFRFRGTSIAGRGGDSGSCVLALLSSNVPSASAWKVIGLLFAGPNHFQYSIGCRITSIVRDLDITSWDGKMPTLKPSRSITLQRSYSPVLELSGRKFYQCGHENYNNPSDKYIY